jgi:membrane protease YdiL (CAAX protease family)
MASPSEPAANPPTPHPDGPSSGAMNRASWLIYPSLLLPQALLFLALGLALAILHWGVGVPGEALESTVVTNSGPIFGTAFLSLLGLTYQFSRSTSTPIPRVQRLLPEVGLGLGIGIALLGLHQLFVFDWLKTFDAVFDPVESWRPWPSALFLFGSAVFAEEVFFRGWALDRLRTRHGAVAATILTSVGYALLVPGLEWVIKAWALSLGLLFAALRLRTNSLLPGILAHLCLTLGPRFLAA